MPAMDLVFVACALACTVGHVAILRSVVRSRSSTVERGVPRPRLGVEIVWALVPAAALVVLLTFTWSRVRERSRAAPPVIMQVAR
ncbi:MAG TPA: hypothetical protein VJ867_15460 [Gemmatimonadaceae bacterium]|nr:hypothetical protein [Gemmatimonadaceae bacterium]